MLSDLPSIACSTNLKHQKAIEEIINYWKNTVGSYNSKNPQTKTKETIPSFTG